MTTATTPAPPTSSSSHHSTATTPSLTPGDQSRRHRQEHPSTPQLTPKPQQQAQAQQQQAPTQPQQPQQQLQLAPQSGSPPTATKETELHSSPEREFVEINGGVTPRSESNDPTSNANSSNGNNSNQSGVESATGNEWHSLMRERSSHLWMKQKGTKPKTGRKLSSVRFVNQPPQRVRVTNPVNGGTPATPSFPSFSDPSTPASDRDRSMHSITLSHTSDSSGLIYHHSPSRVIFY